MVYAEVLGKNFTGGSFEYFDTNIKSYMAESNERIAELIQKFLEENLSETERIELDVWIHASEENRQHFDELVTPEILAARLFVYQEGEAVKADSWKQMAFGEEATPEEVEPVPLFIPLWKRLIAVAAIFLVLATGFILWQYNRKTPIPQPLATTSGNDLLPGTNKAVLTLSGGQQIVLDSAKSGALAKQGMMQVIKKDAGTLSYTATGLHEKSPEAMATGYNTLTTPKSGTFLVVLPDHSKVWLNSASSLRYPTSFAGLDSRTVELTGEAYFEVEKDAARPFRLLVNGLTVDVLGTHFNVNAYADERAVRTTLFEGSVKLVIKDGDQVVLKPGQQAASGDRSGSASAFSVTTPENLKQVIAWKNGFFYFHNDDIQSVMRQLARWYDVDIQYEGKMSTDVFSAMIRRDNKASEVLRILALSDVHFRIEGKRIVVMP